MIATVQKNNYGLVMYFEIVKKIKTTYIHTITFSNVTLMKI